MTDQLLREWPPGYGGVERVAHELATVWGGVVWSFDAQKIAENATAFIEAIKKARPSGAKGTYIGRAFLYGLGALGKEGVTKALNIIKTETDMTMALCGRRDVHDLNRDNIYSLK